MDLAKKVLQKHSTKHSSRPRSYYLHNYVDPMNELWVIGGTKVSHHTTGRKITTGIMNTVREGKTESLQRFETLLNIQLLLDDGGEHWYHNMQRASASTFFTRAFGMHFPTGNEPELKSFLEVLAEGLQLALPSASIINVFPFLDLMPGPMPWRVRAKSFRQRDDALYEKLFDRCLTGEAGGMNTWAAIFASEDKAEGDQRRLMRELAGAAIETTASTLQTFVLACIRYPEWVATAQKELDTVVGSERLPTFKDRPSLPYMEAVLREILRWRPIVRTGVPHKSTADDFVEYNGKEYFIPKGSTVYALTWAMEHDESQYEDHDRFMPERFLDSEGKLKGNYQTSAFGFGRRGIPFAQRSLWIQFATMLWTFNILPSKQCDPKTGLPFVYDDSDAAFGGGVRAQSSLIYLNHIENTLTLEMS
ncbi:hypothetical protein H0H93_005967 [Arthromyces matolae]|nr:hypothetical protein H0H93_005967 [Arthromyces matolae]